ncbi:MAG: arylesterase [Methylotenera sp.]|nr:arylesterase [Methylotenera sp.]MDO9231868.1 arylesterase [Methylotenera sp.]MDO9388740.1 arylesterase [Methylotenera sp.]MDP1596694.1 arylesterase [Methylotenera sp.]MDP1754810.1 arylesterase [Methylotenera sp.]
MLFRLFLVLKTALLSLCVLGLVAWAPATNAENPKILIVGDSLSAAYGIPQQQGWAVLLQKNLQLKNYRYDVVNASMSGETSSGGASRINTALQKTKPAIVILELGANDGLRGLPISEMITNLSNIIRQSKQSGAKVLLIGMQIPPNYGPKYSEAFSQSYLRLSHEHKIPLVPFMLKNIAVQPDLIQQDGLHPNVLAQPMILENIWPQLKLLLKKNNTGY